MASDTARLKYIMEVGPDGFSNVARDRYEYACAVAAENGREETTASDELEGFRRMIDCSIAGGDLEILSHEKEDGK